MSYEPPSPLYVYCPSPQIYFVDKDNGAPLSAGVVTFYEDLNRTVKKPIYQQVQQPDNSYLFVELNNPVTLTSVGTFADDNGNDINVYLYPHTTAPGVTPVGAIELYYITIYSSGGVLQFTREAWPPNAGDNSTNVVDYVATANQLTNPQFVDINYIPDPVTGIFSYIVNSGTTTISVAPSWDLIVTAASSGTVTVQQIGVTENNLTSNPPFALQIGSTGVSSIQLRQRLTASPKLLYSAYISSYFEMKTISPSGNVTVAMTYKPDSVTAYDLASGIATNTYQSFAKNTAINGDANTTVAPNGYVDVNISWTANNTIQITSVQIIGVENGSSDVSFIEQSTPLQQSNLSYYYMPKLQFMPNPNYALGWDFKNNPGQALGSSVGLSGLAGNKARYIADQTIAFESVGNSLSYTLSNAGLTFSCAANTQFALIQYLDATTAFELLQAGTLSVQISGASAATILKGYVSLWWAINVPIPSIPISTNNATFFSSLTAGIPTTITSGWTIIPNPNGAVVSNANTECVPFQLDGVKNLNGWVTPDLGTYNDATYFAIVVSFDTVPSANTNNNINYVTLNAGDLATFPPAMNKAQTLQGLRYYYQKSFDPEIVPAYMAGIGIGTHYWAQTAASGSASPTGVNFYTPLRSIPSVGGPVNHTLLYNPIENNASAYSFNTSNSCGPTSVQNPSKNSFWISTIGVASTGGLIGIQWTADARLGEVT